MKSNINNSNIYIYGAGGFGRSLISLIYRSINNKLLQNSNLYFIDDHKSGSVNNIKIINFQEFVKISKEERAKIIIAVSEPNIRKQISVNISSLNCQIISINAINSIIDTNLVIGIGSILTDFVYIGTNVKIGKYFHANIFSYVEHDCQIGDYVTLAPGAKCNGNIIVEDFVYVGSGAIVKQGSSIKPLTIGRGSVIGMGSVVIDDIPSGVVVAGNPARIIKRLS